jgi:hypothetical protein
MVHIWKMSNCTSKKGRDRVNCTRTTLLICKYWVIFIDGFPGLLHLQPTHQCEQCCYLVIVVVSCDDVTSSARQMKGLERSICSLRFRIESLWRIELEIKCTELAALCRCSCCPYGFVSASSMAYFYKICNTYGICESVTRATTAEACSLRKLLTERHCLYCLTLRADQLR